MTERDVVDEDVPMIVATLDRLGSTIRARVCLRRAIKTFTIIVSFVRLKPITLASMLFSLA
jgi:hypothetical protein